jgi:anti-anti-sigma factor
MVRRITQSLSRTLRHVDEAFARTLEPIAMKTQSWCSSMQESEAMRGRLNFRNASTLRKALFALLAKPRRVIGLKCANVEFADGAAVAAVLEFAMACQQSGTRLYFMEPSESLVNAFRFYGLSSMIDALSTRAPALPTSQAMAVDDPLVIIVEDEFPESIRIEPMKEAA